MADDRKQHDLPLTMPTGHMPDQLGIVRSYDDLIAVMQTQRERLDLAYDTLEELAGLSFSCAPKLLVGRKKCFGPMSFAALLGALGIKLIAVVDHEALEKVRGRLVPRHAGPVRSAAARWKRQKG